MRNASLLACLTRRGGGHTAIKKNPLRGGGGGGTPKDRILLGAPV
jgi:hypothetical protein